MSEVNQQNGRGHSTEKQVLDKVFTETYKELRKLAYAVKLSDSSSTLNPTALVDEAYMKLARSPEVATRGQVHFKRIAARAMRQILVEAARRRSAEKRGGEYAVMVTLGKVSEQISSNDKELVALDSALEELARFSPRQAALVEYRFFAGLEVTEIASLLEISEATVLRDWRAAKAWLERAISKRS